MIASTCDEIHCEQFTQSSTRRKIKTTRLSNLKWCQEMSTCAPKATDAVFLTAQTCTEIRKPPVRTSQNTNRLVRRSVSRVIRDWFCGHQLTVSVSGGPDWHSFVHEPCYVGSHVHVRASRAAFFANNATAHVTDHSRLG